MSASSVPFERSEPFEYEVCFFPVSIGIRESKFCEVFLVAFQFTNCSRAARKQVKHCQHRESTQITADGFGQQTFIQ